jgi:flagellar hook protein FlgE
MSFYTSLTGLNSATAQLAVTANNIANVGTSGFKRSRADFGDIFSTSPLQKSSAQIGQGVSLKQVSQEFSQGNVSTSGNSLDLAITGDGFFPLKSPDGLQDIYTRNGSFTLNDQNNVVNSTGQRLMAASVDSSGKADLSNLTALTIPPKTTGEAKETKNIQLGLNLPADSEVIFAPFDRTDPSTYNKSTALTVYDSGGNGYLATVYYVKTQNASQDAPQSKWQTYFFIGDTQAKPELLQATNESGAKLFVNKYGRLASSNDVNSDGSKVVTPPSGKTEMYSYDDVTVGQQLSQPAEAETASISAQLSGTNSYYTTAGASPTLPATLELLISVDGQTAPQLISYTTTAADENPLVLARNLEVEINNRLGALANADDRRYGIQVSYATGTTSFTFSSGTTGDASSIQIAANNSSATASALGLPDSTGGLSTFAQTAIGEDAQESSDAAVRGEISSPAVLNGATITQNTTKDVTVTLNNNKFYVSADGIGGNLEIANKTYTINELAEEIQTAINGGTSTKTGVAYAGISDPGTGRKVLGVSVEFDSRTKQFVFRTATTGDEASIQVTGSADWGLDKTDIQFGTTSTWIDVAKSQYQENGANQYVKNGVQTEDGADVSTSTTWWPVFLDRGELSFKLDGTPFSPSGPMPYEIAFLDGGKGALDLTIDFTKSTQYSSAFAVLSQSQDGAPEGELMGLNIGVDGLVSATYSNGSQNSLGKIVLANFSSPTGLRQVGDASYLASATSGIAKIGEAGSAGFGSIRAGATERSNVDLTQELVDLITAQRNFQANAKAIETSSTMTQAIVNIRA